MDSPLTKCQECILSYSGGTMSRQLHRGVSGGGQFSPNNHDLWDDDSQMKDKAEKEDIDRKSTNADHTYLSIRQPFRFLFADNASSKHGSLTKRMMMYDEDQISFRSASPRYDDMEDYAHQIAEMIGLRNESNFIQSGV